jgi:hypothetical protein
MEDIEAKLEDGLLTMTIRLPPPQKEESIPVQISYTSGGNSISVGGGGQFQNVQIHEQYSAGPSSHQAQDSTGQLAIPSSST